MVTAQLEPVAVPEPFTATRAYGALTGTEMASLASAEKVRTNDSAGTCASEPLTVTLEVLSISWSYQVVPSAENCTFHSIEVSDPSVNDVRNVS